MKETKKTPECELKKSLSLSLFSEEDGLHLNIKSDITPEDIDLVTGLLIQDKLMALAEGTQEGKNESHAIDTYIKILSLIVTEYRTKLSKALIIIEDEQNQYKNK
jgi:hypothetical protein